MVIAESHCLVPGQCHPQGGPCSPWIFFHDFPLDPSQLWIFATTTALQFWGLLLSNQLVAWATALRSPLALPLLHCSDPAAWLVLLRPLLLLLFQGFCWSVSHAYFSLLSLTALSCLFAASFSCWGILFSCCYSMTSTWSKLLPGGIYSFWAPPYLEDFSLWRHSPDFRRELLQEPYGVVFTALYPEWAGGGGKRVWIPAGHSGDHRTVLLWLRCPHPWGPWVDTVQVDTYHICFTLDNIPWDHAVSGSCCIELSCALRESLG